jgi:hypothetical protein
VDIALKRAYMSEYCRLIEDWGGVEFVLLRWRVQNLGIRICTPCPGSPELGGQNLHSPAERSKFQANEALCSAAIFCNLSKTKQIYTIYSRFVQFRSVGDYFKLCDGHEVVVGCPERREPQDS